MEDKYRLLIIKYLLKDLNEEEDKDLSRWLNADSQNQKKLEEAKKAWDRSSSIPFDFQPDTENAWNKVRAKTIGKSKPIDIRQNPSNKNYISILWKAAAILLIVVGITFIITRTEQDSTTLAGVSETYTSDSVKLLVELTDGSQVWLNANTTLICDASFNKQTRTVQLMGEAFFEVAKDAERPFVILSEATKTTILGTAFNLRARKDEKNTELVVVHGKVSFANSNTGEIILEKGDKGIINNETGEAIKSTNDDMNFMAWKEEKLIFNKTGFGIVKRDIEKYFSVPLEIESEEILKCYFTGSFDKPQIEDVLNVIKVTMGINHRKEKNKIVFFGNGCN